MSILSNKKSKIQNLIKEWNNDESLDNSESLEFSEKFIFRVFDTFDTFFDKLFEKLESNV